VELTRRLRRLEEAADAVPDQCPDCIARLVGAWEAAGLEAPDTSQPVLCYPMDLEGNGPQRDYGPCPVCGAVPAKLRPMRLDGDVDLSDDDKPTSEAMGDPARPGNV
jgi:hypothetical protein